MTAAILPARWPAAPATVVEEPKTRSVLVYAVATLSVWIAVQDPVLALLYRYAGHGMAVSLLVAKDVFTWGLVLVMLGLRLATGRLLLRARSLFAVSFILLITTYLIVGPRTQGDTWTSARSLADPIILVECGYLLSPSISQLRTLLRVVVLVSLLSVAVGSFDSLLLGAQTIWVGLTDLPRFLLDVKGVPPSSLRSDIALPFNFWFASPAGTLRRLVGLSGDPLSTGYYLIFPAVLTTLMLLQKRFDAIITHHKRAITFVIICGLLLTITRGAIIATIFGILFALLIMARRRRESRGTLGAIEISIVIMLVSLLPGASNVIGSSLNLNDYSSAGHIQNNLSGIARLRYVIWNGDGIGAAGGASQFHGGDEQLTGIVGENAYLVIAAQLGIIGLVLFACWILSLFTSLLRASGNVDPSTAVIYIGILGALFGYTVSGIFSEQMLTFTSMAHFWLIAGAALGHCDRGSTAAAIPSLVEART